MEKDEINHFIKNYIDDFLIKDIQTLMDLEKDVNSFHRFSYPFLLLSFSGIDLFGILYKGYSRSNVQDRFCAFINDYMGQIYELYKFKGMSKLIYECCRCGIVHNAILKDFFEVSSFRCPENKHLYLRNDEKLSLIFLHSRKFSSDFIKAKNIFQNDIEHNKLDVDTIYQHLSDMINDNPRDFKGKKKEERKRINTIFIDVKNLLKSKNMVFSESDCIMTTTKTLPGELIGRNEEG